MVRSEFYCVVLCGSLMLKNMCHLSWFYAPLLLLYLAQVEGGPTRVVGGNEAPSQFARIQASLQNLTGHHVCGGAIVSLQHVVTAAHCVQGVNPRFTRIVVGTTNLDVGGKHYDVASIKVHQEFNASMRTNDIAIIRARNKFDPFYVDVLELNEKELRENDSVILIGFGAFEPNGESSRIMHVLRLPVFNQETCQYAMRYSREVTDRMFCTFSKIGEGTCHGDSGGPLVKDNRLVGLVSWGIPCAVGFPDVHTRITSYITWIKEKTRK